MFKFLFKSKFLGFVEAPVGVFQILSYVYVKLGHEFSQTLIAKLSPSSSFSWGQSWF